MNTLEEMIDLQLKTFAHNTELVMVLNSLKYQFCTQKEPVVSWQWSRPAATIEFVQTVLHELVGNDVPIEPQTTLDQLKIDDLDMIELVMLFEDEFGFEIKDSDNQLRAMTVTQVVEYLQMRITRDV